MNQTRKTCTRLNTETKKTKQQLNLKLRLGGLTGLGEKRKSVHSTQTWCLTRQKTKLSNNAIQQSKPTLKNSPRLATEISKKQGNENTNSELKLKQKIEDQTTQQQLAATMTRLTTQQLNENSTKNPELG